MEQLGLSPSGCGFASSVVVQGLRKPASGCKNERQEAHAPVRLRKCAPSLSERGSILES